LVALALTLGLGLAACGGGGGGSVASFCNEVRSDKSTLGNSSNSAAGEAALKDVEKKAPSAIKPDIKTIVDFIDSASATKQPSAADLAKVETAGKNITSYVKDKCKVDLDTGT
jgi:hypothetical protein